ncbi:MAG: hypothetical protein ACR2QX_11580 [Woeseiaceae bacterium]
MASLVTTVYAGPREQAKRIHDRLAGVPPTDSVLQQMENAIQSSDPACATYGVTGPACAAYIAMDNQYFYNVTLKNFAAPWTNRDQSVFVPLNDYIATVIGMTRDDVDFSTLLSADLTYVGRSGIVQAAPSASDNNHFAQLEANNVDLSSPTDFVPTAQSAVLGIPSSATAGVITSRAAAEAFFIAGTNRAMFRFTLMNHMCNDMEQMHDPKLPPDRIRQDVSRSPGGDSRLFLNNCIGCHTGMDPMAQAFAYYNYDEASGRLQYTPGVVQPKYFNNDLNFPQGYRTPNDRWDNYWRQGQNAYLGFGTGSRPTTGSGNGAKSLGEEFGNSAQFASCQVRKVFRTVCLRDPDMGDPNDSSDRDAVTAITNTFRSTGYRMKQVFADTAVHCMGQ